MIAIFNTLIFILKKKVDRPITMKKENIQTRNRKQNVRRKDKDLSLQFASFLLKSTNQQQTEQNINTQLNNNYSSLSSSSSTSSTSSNSQYLNPYTSNKFDFGMAYQQQPQHQLQSNQFNLQQHNIYNQNQSPNMPTQDFNAFQPFTNSYLPHHSTENILSARSVVAVAAAATAATLAAVNSSNSQFLASTTSPSSISSNSSSSSASPLSTSISPNNFNSSNNLVKKAPHVHLHHHHHHHATSAFINLTANSSSNNTNSANVSVANTTTNTNSNRDFDQISCY